MLFSYKYSGAMSSSSLQTTVPHSTLALENIAGFFNSENILSFKSGLVSNIFFDPSPKLINS